MEWLNNYKIIKNYHNFRTNSQTKAKLNKNLKKQIKLDKTYHLNTTLYNKW